MTERQPTSLDVHPKDHSLMVIGYSDGLIEIKTKGEAKRVGSAAGEVTLIRWAPDGSMKLACVVADQAIVFERSQDHWLSRGLKGHSLDVTGLSWSSDSKRLATSSRDAKIILWEVAQPRQISTITASGWVEACAIDPASRYIAGCVGTTVFVWRIEDAVVQYPIDLSARATCVDWSPDGKYLCCANQKGKVVLVDRTNAGAIQLLGFGSDTILRVRFSRALYRQDTFTGPLLCVASVNQVVVFFSRSGTALESWALKCDDIAWAGPMHVVYCTREGPVSEARAVQLPEGTTVLSQEEVASVLSRTYGGRVDGGGDAKKDSFVETVTQLEVEARARAIEQQQLESVRAAHAQTSLAGGGNGVPQQQQQQRESVTKSGKKRIQPVSASANLIPQGPGLNTTTIPSSVTSSTASSSITTAQPTSSTTVAGEGTSATVMGPPPPPPPPPASLSSNSGTSAPGMNGISSVNTVDDADCGRCKYCLDKPRFGGKNVLRQRCVNRPPLAKRPKSASAGIRVDDDDDEEDDGEDGWGSGDEEQLEADSENELGPFLLAPLQFFDAYYAESQHQHHSYSIGGKFTLNLSSRNRQRTTVSCYNTATHERLWTSQVRGVVAGFACDESVIAFATSLHEVHVHSTKSGAAIMCPVALSSACAFLEISRKKFLVVCSREGRMSIFNLTTMQFHLSDVLLSPLVQLRGKPFTLNEQASTQSDTSRSCVLHVSDRGIPVLMVASRRDSTCCAYAYVSGTKFWSKVLDPSRFIGSDFCTLHRSTSIAVAAGAAQQGEVEMLHRKLLYGLAAVTSASQATLTQVSSEVSSAQTVSHVESLVHACRTLESPAEEHFWLGILFERFAMDFTNYNCRAKWWLSFLEKQVSNKTFVQSELLPRLAKNREYQAHIEEWNEYHQDLKLVSNGLQSI